MGNFRLLLQLYRRPLATFSKVIDEGHFLFAVCVAVLCAVLLQVPRSIEFARDFAKVKAYAAAHKPEIARARAELAKTAPKGDAAAQNDSDDDDEDVPAPTSFPGAGFARVDLAQTVDILTNHALFHYLSGLLAVALCFVPAAILVMTLWESLGGVVTILYRDYLTLLVCILLAWTAAYLPLALGRAVLVAANAPASSHPVFWWVAHAYFVVLSVFAIRIVFGTSFGHAAGAAAGGWAGSLGGLCVYSVAGSSLSWLASPFLLFYLYRYVQPDIGSFGVSFRSRQALKQHLENATVNPRDADAHYQLGLIYQQRRQFAAAIDRFRKAAEIDPAAADPHYQLGRIARQTDRFDEAIKHLEAAARCDDKCSSSEVWREIGVAHLLGGRSRQAMDALARYVERRPYDPEGQCWYGRALLKVGLRGEARQAFSEAIESVRTMPQGRKKQVSTWGAQAARELRALR